MVRVLHVSDIHLGSGLSHGHINPATGLNTRLEDFTATLARCIDRAIAEPVDLLLFGGDAFPDATPPPLHQEAFACQFRRLADADIPAVLLVGNHDQHGQGQEGNSLGIYRTLSVPGFVVGDRLRTVRLQTQGGPVQVTTLPWLNQSTLLTQPEIEGLSGSDIAKRLLQRLDLALEAETRQLHAGEPAILLAHAMVDRARYGAERHLAVGKGFTVPLSLLARPAYQYVALGHVHRHQVLCDAPPVVYPGSIERVDFSEENEEKGFVLAEVRAEGASYSFVPLSVRRFCTIRVDGTEDVKEPLMTRLLQAIAAAEVRDAVVRLAYRIRADQLEEVDDRALHAALATAASYAIAPEVVATARSRLPSMAATDLTPLTALEHYLNSRDDLAGLREDMLLAAQALIDDVEFEGGETDPDDEIEDEAGKSQAVEQLNLLADWHA
jgi:exonuclease SbcD